LRVVARVDVTVFTSTYNRVATLPRVRESLLSQTLDPTRFEWIIVDDGSTDGTGDLVRSWGDAPFSVDYRWQENRGKHCAWNRAVEAAKGELFVSIDSDDGCVPEALERFVSAWGPPEANRRDLAGVLARCQTAEGVAIGPPLPSMETVDFAELSLRRLLPHDTWSAMRTGVLREFPFPELRARLVPEGSLFQRVARRYRWLTLDECLLVYFRAEHGRPDQLSRLSPWRYPAGVAFMQRTVLDHSWRLARKVPLELARAAVHFDRFSLHAGSSLFDEIGSLEHRGARALCWAALPVGAAMVVADHLRHKASGDSSAPTSARTSDRSERSAASERT
jgi:glycosyltransferase involved in cell wall biosynthesis